MMYLRFQSALRSPVERVWEGIMSGAGINDEMRPLITMSMPDPACRLDALAFQPGVPLFRSQLRLFGIVPVGVSHLTLLSLSPMTGFIERSPMTGMRQWRHERHLAPAPGGCTLLDTLEFEPRCFPGVARALVSLLFRHRHRRLCRRYG